MSNYPPDPYPPDPYPPDPYRQPEYPPPGSYQPGQPGERDPFAQSPSQVSGRVTAPAVGLLLVAAANFLLGLGLLGLGFIYSKIPPDKAEEMLEKQNAQQVAQMRQAGLTVEAMLKVYTYGGLGGGALALVVALVTAVGAIRMLMLRSYGLAVIASVLAAIPCVSPGACPCLFGMAVGVWALVILLDPEVRSAFR
jgi:hypothetical protein